MKILLAKPSYYKPDGQLYKKKKKLVIPITQPYMAGLTPKNIDIHLVDEHFTDIDTSIDYDLVGLSVFGAAEKRAIDVAKGFRDRGIQVVAGGVHATMAPERLQDHVDSVCIGESELIWDDILIDAQKKRLKPRYQATEIYDMKNMPHSRYDLIDMKRFWVKFFPIQTTRGCPFPCKFCEVTSMYGKSFRFRPIEDIVAEIKTLPKRNLYIVDDNIGGKVSRAKELFKALIPLKVKWGGMTTIHSIQDEEFVRLAKQSGCIQLNLGVESINDESLKSINKKHNKVKSYREQVKLLEMYKLPYSLNFILGIDGDPPDIVEQTIDFCREVKPPMAYFAMLTPRPGTELMKELIAEDRILHTNYDRYDQHECVFEPKSMTPTELEVARWRCYEDFYSIKQILKRFCTPPRFHLSREFFLAMFARHGVKNRIDPASFY